jgi:predicted transcriptional regulator
MDNNPDTPDIRPDFAKVFGSFDPKPINDQELDDTYKVGSVSGVYALTLEDLLAKEFSDDIWLIDNLIPINGTTVLSALPGSFKTWLLLDIAKCVASGESLFGEFNAKQKGVLIIDEENGERVLQQRFLKLGVAADLPIYYLSDIGFKITSDSVQDIVEFCQDLEIGLVTFDSLVRIHEANENDAKEMAEVFHLIRQLNKQDVTVLLTHHNRKPSGGGGNPAHEMRGSSDILAALDCHLALTRRDGKDLLLTQTKVRLAEELPPLELEIISDDNSVSIKYVGSMKPSETKREMAKQAIIEMLSAHASLNQGQILATLDMTEARVNARTLRTILATMLESGLIVTSRGERNSIIYKLTDTPEEPTE